MLPVGVRCKLIKSFKTDQDSPYQKWAFHLKMFVVHNKQQLPLGPEQHILFPDINIFFKKIKCG